MPMDMGLGPVFESEWRAGTRRWQLYALRAVLVLLLGLGLWGVWLSHEGVTVNALSHRQLAEIGRAFYSVTSLILLGLVGLVAPAATAGAICQDKDRGNLMLLFATDLRAREIVAGKLAARLVPVLGLIGCAAPVLVLATPFGGVDPGLLIGAVLVCLGCAVFGCSLALVLSVWGRKMHEVVLATYAFGITWLLLGPVWMGVTMGRTGLAWLPGPYALLPLNPVFLVLAPLGSAPGMPIRLADQARFAAVGLGVSALLVALAVWRVRPVALRQVSRGGTAARVGWLGRLTRRLPGPTLDGNPILWREWHRSRPTRWSTFVWGGFALASLASIAWVLDNRIPGTRDVGTVINGLQVSVGLLLLSVSAVTSLAEERQRGSLDVILATPLSTVSIVMGKWWGAFRLVPLLATYPMLMALILTNTPGAWSGFLVIGALVMAQGAALTSLGLALATWRPQVGRAIALSSGTYILVLVGPIPLAHALFGPGGVVSNSRDLASGLSSASPFWGVGYTSSLLDGMGSFRRDYGGQVAWLVFWITVYTLLAAGLLLLTLATFNRRLGRVDEFSKPR